MKPFNFVLLCALISAIFFGLHYFSDERYEYITFIPSKKCCGAAKNKNNDCVIDEINCRIKCMIAGYKNIYWGSYSELNIIAKEFLPLKKFGIEAMIVENGITYNIPNREPNIILYTQAGKKYALLLEKYEQIFEKKYSKKLTRENVRKNLNDYLVGYLLDYSEEDIKYFYSIDCIENFERDKQKALSFIRKHES